MTNKELMQAMQQAGRLQIVSVGNNQPQKETTMKTESYEGLVGRAITGTPEEKVLAMSRVTCKMNASHRMTCVCGGILDQKTIVCVEIHADNKETPVTAMCPKCWPGFQDALRKNGVKPGVKVVTWSGVHEPLEYTIKTPRAKKGEVKSNTPKEYSLAELVKGKCLRGDLYHARHWYGATQCRMATDGRYIFDLTGLSFNWPKMPKKITKVIESGDCGPVDVYHSRCAEMLRTPDVTYVLQHHRIVPVNGTPHTTIGTHLTNGSIVRTIDAHLWKTAEKHFGRVQFLTCKQEADYERVWVQQLSSMRIVGVIACISNT
jgi:hypothetical protein